LFRIFVSHSAPLVRQLCERALWLDLGEVMTDGRAGEVIEACTRPRPVA
jgi:ABC-type polysaccharide/polyol phosphate transport system ATPase subunit